MKAIIRKSFIIAGCGIMLLLQLRMTRAADLPQGRIAFVGREDSILRILNTTTGETIKVPNTPVNGICNEAGWFGSSGEWLHLRGRSGLYMIRPDGTGLKQILYGNAGGPHSPANGEWIVFHRIYGGVLRMNPDGSGLTELPIRLAHVRASRDGRYITGADWAVAPGGYNSNMYVYDLETQQLANVTKAYRTAVNEAFLRGEMSPDNTKIATDHLDRAAGQCDIWLIKWRDSGYVNLTADWSGSTESMPSWSPDGRFIIFVSNREGNPDIWAMRPDGSGRVNLTRTKDISEDVGTPHMWMPPKDKDNCTPMDSYGPAPLGSLRSGFQGTATRATRKPWRWNQLSGSLP